MWSSDPYIYEMTHMCSPKHCAQMRGERERTQRSDRWTDIENENENFLGNRLENVVPAVSAYCSQTLNNLWRGRAKPEDRLMQVGEGGEREDSKGFSS